MVALLFNEKTQESTFAVYDATQLRRSAGPSVGVGYSNNIGALIIAHTNYFGVSLVKFAA